MSSPMDDVWFGLGVRSVGRNEQTEDEAENRSKPGVLYTHFHSPLFVKQQLEIDSDL